MEYKEAILKIHIVIKARVLDPRVGLSVEIVDECRGIGSAWGVANGFDGVIKQFYTKLITIVVDIMKLMLGFMVQFWGNVK